MRLPPHTDLIHRRCGLGVVVEPRPQNCKNRAPCSSNPGRKPATISRLFSRTSTANQPKSRALSAKTRPRTSAKRLTQERKIGRGRAKNAPDAAPKRPQIGSLSGFCFFRYGRALGGHGGVIYFHPPLATFCRRLARPEKRPALPLQIAPPPLEPPPRRGDAGLGRGIAWPAPGLRPPWTPPLIGGAQAWRNARSLRSLLCFSRFRLFGAECPPQQARFLRVRGRFFAPA